MKDAKKYTNGCVRKLEHRKNKPFVGILKYKSGGEWKQVTKTLHGATGKKDAERLLEIWWEDMEARAEINPAVPPKLAKKIVDKTVKQAIEEFLELQYKTKDLEESTYQTQCFYARKHVFPYIGDLVFEKTGYYTRIGTSFQTIGTAFRSIGTVILPSSAHPQNIDFKGPTAIESNRALSATRYSSFQRVCRISLSR